MTGTPAGLQTALDVFVGYVMLDAWIANQDRHHENWAAIRLPDESDSRLAPTFDHGASLARNLSDGERKERLESQDESRRVPHDGGAYRFIYTHGARMLADFRPFPQMENLEEVYESEKIFLFLPIACCRRAGRNTTPTCDGAGLTQTIRRTRFRFFQ